MVINAPSGRDFRLEGKCHICPLSRARAARCPAHRERAGAIGSPGRNQAAHDLHDRPGARRPQLVASHAALQQRDRHRRARLRLRPHHFSGDPASGHPAVSMEGRPSHIEDALDPYDLVDPNLRRHDPAYPTPAQLRSKYRVGNIKWSTTSPRTPGSQLIEDVLLDDQPGPVFLQAWGGRHDRSGPDRHPGALPGHPRVGAIYEKVSEKAIITSWGQQDDTYADLHPAELAADRAPRRSHHIWGYGARNSVLPEDRSCRPAWTAENVSLVGPLGAALPRLGRRQVHGRGRPRAVPRNNRCM